jgi:arylsulfatase A-like enzyme
VALHSAEKDAGKTAEGNANNLIALARPERPNILFLFADDMRADTIAALGNTTIKTPNLDRLAHRGLTFNRTYMQGAFTPATCVPSRAMLLSGQNLFHVDKKLMRETTWPEAFGKAGYTTAMSGKWHNGEASLLRSFQIARAIYLTGYAPHPELHNKVDGKLSEGKQAPIHEEESFADEAVTFLRNHQDGPFFYYLPFHAPHDPHIVPPDFQIQYDPATFPLPPNFLPQHPWNNGDMTVRDEKLLPWPRTPESVRVHLSEYYRYISYLDVQIGRVLDALDASPHSKNTIVVFSADSGAARGSHGLFGKQNLYEFDSLRVPFIISGPGIPANKNTDAMCYLFDVLPTLGKICGVPTPNKSDGFDFSATLSDPAKPARRQMLFAYKDVQRAFCDEQWKLIRYPQVDRTQLFNLKNDPYEMTNLAYDPEYAGQVADLMKRLTAEMQQNDDKVPLTVASPQPAEWNPPDKAYGSKKNLKNIKTKSL